jgi:hypothetical protein
MPARWHQSKTPFMERMWSAIEASEYPQAPGVHDLGAVLDLTVGSLLLVVLRAAERWTPNTPLPVDAALVRRHGRIRVQFADDTTVTMDDHETLLHARSVRALVNVGADLATVLLFSEEQPELLRGLG